MRRLLFTLLALLLPVSLVLATPAPTLPIVGPPQFSGDGKFLSAVLRDTIHLSLIDQRVTWDVATGRALHRRAFDLHSKVLHSPDELFYAKGGYQHRMAADDKGAIYKFANRERVSTLEVEAYEKVSPLAFSPDGKLLAGHSYTPEFDIVRKNVRFWDTRTGKRMRLYDKQQGFLLHAAFSADGHRVVTVGLQAIGQSVVVRERQTGKVIKTFALNVGITLPYTDFNLSPDGRFLLTTDIDFAPVSFGGPLNTPIPDLPRNWVFKLCLWNLETGTLAHTFLAPQLSYIKRDKPKIIRDFTMSGINPTARHFSPDGSQLQIAMFDEDALHFKTITWDTQTGAILSQRSLATTSRVSAATFSPDGKRLALATKDGKMELRDAFSLALIRHWDVKLEGEFLPYY